LSKDPRVQQAKQLLLETLHDYQKQIQGVCPSLDTLKQPYAALLKTFAEYRGGPLYFPYIGSGFGKGALVELLDGSIKYDLISGIGPHYWGHHHPDLVEAHLQAALSDIVIQGHLQQNIDAIEIAELLIKASHLDHCFFSSSGAMANENALKIAFQNRFPASRLLAFEKCFAGRTTTLSQVTDKPNFREGLPMTLHVDYVPFYDPSRPQESTLQALETIKKHLWRYPKQHAAMIFELIQGEGGFNAGTTEFFSSIMTLLKDHGIVIIVDEIQTFGRTPSLFAYQHFKLESYVDIVTIGKLSQVCATLFKKNLKPGAGLLSQTFTSSTAAFKASKVIIESLLRDNYLGPNGKIVKIHDYFVNHFQTLEKRYPIKGPYGLGAMIAFTPFNGETQRVTQFAQDLFQAGVISFIAGANPSRIRFLIPIGAITHHDIDKVFHIMEGVLKA
jgi:acetylornithine/N-succinyldiaminopimelate aminotransferase